LTEKWFKPRRYKHLDFPVSERFAEAIETKGFVEKHSWTPLLHYIKSVKRYKPKLGKTVLKPRDIMFASHRDACILSKFSFDLSVKLEAAYSRLGLSQNVIGYRKLGKANYHFSADAREFALQNSPCVILTFDISGFFDNLDHALLKSRLKRLLGVAELDPAWHKVFRHVTRFSKIDLQDLEAHPVFGERIKSKSKRMIATIEEVKAANIPIHQNKTKVGIPQGTPISAVLANLYLIDLDQEMVQLCQKRDALYQRYSDDIIVICSAADEVEISHRFAQLVADHKLSISREKCERVDFKASGHQAIQYLGFDISPEGALIRSSSLSRQWRKLLRSIRKTRTVGLEAVASGRSKAIYTKKLRKRFSPIGVRNFSSYSRKSADVFGGKGILKQVRRLELAADRAIRELKEF
jgi:hypothetical protein